MVKPQPVSISNIPELFTFSLDKFCE